jgi:hypothetical protein
MTTLEINRSNIPDDATPILTYCRALIRDGHDPATRLEVHRTSSAPDIIVRNIGSAAMLGIREGNHAPRFVRYRPPSLEVRQKVRGVGAHALFLTAGSSHRNRKRAHARRVAGLVPKFFPKIFGRSRHRGMGGEKGKSPDPSH